MFFEVDLLYWRDIKQELHESFKQFRVSWQHCRAWYNWTQMCGASGTIAAFTKLHCLCDVSCCLAVDQERLQEGYLWLVVRTFIKFHILLGKRALKCYKSLMEGSGTHAPSYETVRRWVNSFKNGGKGTMSLAVEHQHRQQMSVTWNKLNLFLNMHAVFHAWQLLQKSVYL